MKTLRVKLVGSAMVPDYAAQHAGANRFLGRSVVHPWEPTGADLTVPAQHEYIQHLRHGDLAPLDQETATFAGVPFEEKV